MKERRWLPGPARHRWRRALVAALWVVAGVAFSTVMTRIGIYKPLEAYELDRLIRSVAAADSTSPDIVLVTIDDEDYQHLFTNTSPLSRATFLKLLEAIVMFAPKAMAVDILTEDWLAPPPNELLARTRFVWAAVPARETNTSELRLAPRLPFRTPPSKAICLALPIFQPDEDGVIRSQVASAVTMDYDRRPSLALAIDRVSDDRHGYAWHAAGCEMSGFDRAYDAERTPIRFTGAQHQFRRLRASSVIADAEAFSGNRRAIVPAGDDLRGKIVILGGTFERARDRFNTPIGEIDGVELVAHGVQSYRDHVGEGSPYAVAGVELLIGLLAVWLIAIGRLHWPMEGVAAFVAPFLCAMPVGFFAYNYFGTYLSVAASFVGIPLHSVVAEFMGRGWKLKELEKELKACKEHAVRVGARMLVAILAVLAATPDAHAAKRRAFVAGIDDYVTLQHLSSATDDADRVARALEVSGYKVRRSVNATMAELERDWRRFLAEVDAGDFTVVYFAGHGVQREGVNYLLAADFAGTSVTHTNATPMDRWVADLDARKAAQKIVIVDACRENPLDPKSRGLAAIQNAGFGLGTYLVFVTAPGQTAADGLFARHFVRELSVPGRSVDDVFNGTLAAVRKESGGRQVPFIVNSGGLTDRAFSMPDRVEPLQLAEAGQCRQAIPRLQHVVSDDPDDGIARWALGHCQIAERDVVNGRRNLERARAGVDLLPHVVNTELALAAHAEGDLFDAKARLADALRDQPDYPEALLLQGRMLLEERQFSEAARIFDRVFQRLSDSPKSTPTRLVACKLLADAFDGNGATELAAAQRNRCNAIAAEKP